MSVYRTISQKLKRDIDNGTYKDICGKTIKIGDHIVDWCRGIRCEVRSASHLEMLYSTSWGLLQKVEIEKE